MKRVQTEIGLLPEDWEVKTIGDIGSNYAYGVGAEAVLYDGKNKYIRITDIDDNSHKYVPSPLVSPSFFSENHILKENDIVVARTGASVGKSYIYDSADGNLIYAGFLMKFHVSGENAKHAFYHLTTARYQTWVSMNSVRSGQPGLNLQQLKEFQLPLPKDKTEQQNIASALSSIDKLIDDLGRTIQKKQNIREGAMEELLSGKKRLPGFSEAWVEKRMGNVLKIGHGKDYKHLTSGPYPVYGTGGYMTSVSEYLYDGQCPCIGRKGTINNPMYLQGRFWTVDTLFYTHSFNGVDPKFMFYIFKTIDWDSLNEATGVPSLTANNIENIIINVPSDLREQHAIADILTSMDDEISLLQSERAKYEQIRAGMMEELLTGKKRLK